MLYLTLTALVVLQYVANLWTARIRSLLVVRPHGPAGCVCLCVDPVYHAYLSAGPCAARGISVNRVVAFLCTLNKLICILYTVKIGWID